MITDTKKSSRFDPQEEVYIKKLKQHFIKQSIKTFITFQKLNFNLPKVIK